MVDGMLELIPNAKVGHVGLYRDPETKLPVEYYCKLPEDIDKRRLIIVDPMLATGGSSCAAIDLLKQKGGEEISLTDFCRIPHLFYCKRLSFVNTAENVQTACFSGQSMV